MRLLDLTRLTRSAALVSFAVLLSACPKKESEATPEPAAPAAAQAPASDKAGAEAPAAAPAKKKDEDKGGW